MTHWASAQAQPEVNHNVALDILDGKVAGQLTVDTAGDSDYSLATTGTEPFEWQYGFIDVTNTGTAWTGGHILNVPAKKSFYVVRNGQAVAVDLTVQVTGGGGANVTIAQGALAYVYCDGTDVIQVAAGAGGVEFKDYVVATYIGGAPTASQEILRFVATHAITFASGMGGSYSKASTASTGTPVFSVKKNGTEFATITFTTSATGVVTSSTDTSFAAGDQLTIVAPASPDATLVDIAVSLKATRD